MLLQEAFKILGLAEGADRAEIRRAYAKLSKIYHVETHPEEFSRLHEAYKLALSVAEGAGTRGTEDGNLGVFGDFASVTGDDIEDGFHLFWEEKDGNARSNLSENEENVDTRSNPSGSESSVDTHSNPSGSENSTDAHSNPSGSEDSADTHSNPPDSENGADTHSNQPNSENSADTHSNPSDSGNSTDTQTNLFDTKNNENKDSANQDASQQKSPDDDILDRILGMDFSIQNCGELTQLLYYRCRYDEISPEIDTVLLRITNAEQGITDAAQMQTSYEATAALPDQKEFLGIPWGTWKSLDWTCIVCHPDFYREQYTNIFLDELYRFLLDEILNLRDGIRQELYFAICMAYDFFSDKEKFYGKEKFSDKKGFSGKKEFSGKKGFSETKEFSDKKDFSEKKEFSGKNGVSKDTLQNQDSQKNLLLSEIEKLLRLHPKHKEYIKDLEAWPECQTARRIVLFCQEAYAELIRAGQQTLDLDTDNGNTTKNIIDSDKNIDSTDKNSTPSGSHPENISRIPETAAELLLDDEIPWKEFIYDDLTNFFPTNLSAQFSEKREEFRQLNQLRRDFSHDFINLLDNSVAENYIYNNCYLPLAIRLNRIKDRYLTKKDWKKIICRPVFLQAFKNWLFPRHNGFSSVPCIMHYDAWKMLRTCFEGSSEFEKDSIRYLTTEFYFPEYEKRYQRELLWEEEHIEEAYFLETFPLPALSQGKLDLLETIKNATPATMAEVEKIFGNLSFDAAGFDFLTRISNAMTHFNFLLVTGKNEKDAVPGDAFCFLKDEVLLYRRKENIVCRLTHPIFYDLISWKFETAAYPVINGRAGYDEDFINTACRNLYYYRCYATQKKWNGSSSEFSE